MEHKPEYVWDRLEEPYLNGVTDIIDAKMSHLNDEERADLLFDFIRDGATLLVARHTSSSKARRDILRRHVSLVYERNGIPIKATERNRLSMDGLWLEATSGNLYTLISAHISGPIVDNLIASTSITSGDHRFHARHHVVEYQDALISVEREFLGLVTPRPTLTLAQTDGTALRMLPSTILRGVVRGVPIPSTTTATTGEKSMAINTAATIAEAKKLTAAFASAKKSSAPLYNMVSSNLASIDGNDLDKINTIVDALVKGLEEAESKPAAPTGPTGMTLTIGEGMHVKASPSGKLPSGTCVTKKAKDLFDITGASAKNFDFDVPFYEWDSAHPRVPEVDPHYQFDRTVLLGILTGLITNQRTWLYGDTGSGKTTAIEQVAARLNYPVYRENFNSHITPMDLIGTKDLVVDPSTKATITSFTEGVLPRAMQQPCIFLCDELDFIRADVAYVFQRALEGNGLSITEDGGRIIQPHAGFRIFATGNTQGNGDETGRYQGAKPQSSAFLDRFTLWIKVDYMSAGKVEGLLRMHYPSIGDAAKVLSAYAQEHWTSFANAELLTALTPRGLLACAATYQMLASTFDSDQALARAMTLTFVDRANPEDGQTIKGLVARVSKAAKAGASSGTSA